MRVNGKMTNIIDISDIHAGHQKIHSSQVHKNFNDILYPRIDATLDLLIFNGDFFEFNKCLNFLDCST